MDIKNSHTLTKAIEEVAPFCAGWALTDKVGDIRHMAQARFRSLMYKEFDIPKRSGGTRRITAPTGKLKDIQRCISAIVAPFYRTPEHEGQFLKIVPFYKSLIISTLLLSGFILCYLVLSKTACKFACK